MARHHNYSKRSRESRKAKTEGAGDQPDYPDLDDLTGEDWHARDDEPAGPPDPLR